MLLALCAVLFSTTSQPAPAPPNSPTASKVIPQEQVNLEQAYAQSKADLKKSPSDNNKKAHAHSAFLLGEYIMTANHIPSHEKYPKALGYFREALTLRPDYAEARGNINMIEGIYESLGKPIPKN